MILVSLWSELHICISLLASPSGRHDVNFLHTINCMILSYSQKCTRRPGYCKLSRISRLFPNIPYIVTQLKCVCFVGVWVLGYSVVHLLAYSFVFVSGML